MMSWKKVFIWGFFLFLLSISTSSQTRAATNKTQCRWNDDTGQCYQWVDCNPGCVPPVLNCPSMSPNVCQMVPAPYDCNCAGSGTLRCEWKDTVGGGGYCRRIGDCGLGYEPSPAADPCLPFQKNDCSGVDAGTCIQSTIPQPPPPPPPPPPTGCDDPDAIPTAIGCINVKSPEGFVSNILTLAIGIGGGIAMLLIIFGGIQILTSAGNPEKIQAGKELITSAIAGLLLIIFSVFILRIIGVEVLKIFE